MVEVEDDLVDEEYPECQLYSDRQMDSADLSPLLMQWQ
jgi:hypothetical protein